MGFEQSPKLEEFAQRAKASTAGRSDLAGNVALAKVSDELDDRINFRVNSVLKEAFDRVCKANHSNSARELKRFMTEVVRTQRVL